MKDIAETVKTVTPGKIHLIGEHAVVYGEPAIIAAINLNTILELTAASDLITLPDKSTHKVIDVKEFASKIARLWEHCSQENDFSAISLELKKDANNFKLLAIGTVLNELELDCGFSLNQELELPSGAGLGSSAAFAVGISKGISKLANLDLKLDRINSLAFKIEQYVNGRPSGGDNTACCYGGLIWFEKNLSGGKNNIEPLPVKLSADLGNFTILNTGKPEKTTAELVQHVANLEESYRSPRIKAIGELAAPMLKSFKQSDREGIIKIINQSHKYLSELGVSTSLMDEIQQEVEASGGAAKLCGAGGGGVMLCYCSDLKLIEKSYSKRKLKIYPIRLAS